MAMDTVIAYTDGACAPNPGTGAWAYRLEWPNGRVEERAVHELQTTNNRQELIAVREALHAIRRTLGEDQDWRIVIRTDSMDVINWLTSNSRRKANLDLYPTIDPLIDGRVRFEPVPGHSGDAGNDRVDRLAKIAMREAARLLSR